MQRNHYLDNTVLNRYNHDLVVISSILSKISGANASELIENRDDIFSGLPSDDLQNFH